MAAMVGHVVVSDDATGHRSGDGMMPGHMPNNGASHRAANTTAGLSALGGADGRGEQSHRQNECAHC